MLLPSPIAPKTHVSECPTRTSSLLSGKTGHVSRPPKRSRQGARLASTTLINSSVSLASSSIPLSSVESSFALMTSFPDAPSSACERWPPAKSGSSGDRTMPSEVVSQALAMYEEWSSDGHAATDGGSSTLLRRYPFAQSSRLCLAASALRQLRLQQQLVFGGISLIETHSTQGWANDLQVYFSPPTTVAGEAQNSNDHSGRLSQPVLALFANCMMASGCFPDDELSRWLITTYVASAEVQRVVSATHHRNAKTLWAAAAVVVNVLSVLMTSKATEAATSHLAGSFVRQLLRAIFDESSSSSEQQPGTQHKASHAASHPGAPGLQLSEVSRRQVQHRRRVDALLALMHSLSSKVHVRTFVAQSTERDVLAANFFTPPQSVAFLGVLSS